MPAALADRLWPGPGPDYLAPTCLPDLAEMGTAQRILGGDGPIAARFPAGRAAVHWLAIGTTWNGDPGEGPAGPPPVQAAHALLGVDPTRTPPGVSDAISAVRTMIDLMGAGRVSDVVVPLSSQLGLDGLTFFPDNRRVRPWIAHSEPFGFLGETQLRSPGIVADVRRALAQPLDELDLGAAPPGPPGPPRVRSDFAFGRLGPLGEPAP
jgi:hypothetical protein